MAKHKKVRPNSRRHGKHRRHRDVVKPALALTSIAAVGGAVTSGAAEPPDDTTDSWTLPELEVTGEWAAASVDTGTDFGLVMLALNELEPAPRKTEEPEAVIEPEPVPEVPGVIGQMFTTEALRIRSGPGTHARILAVIFRGGTVDLTGTVEGDWVQVIYEGAVAWAHGDYLSDTEPEPEPVVLKAGSYPATGLSVESGLQPNALNLLRALAYEFPEIETFWGVAERSTPSDHPTGHAVDVMIPSWDSPAGADLGWRIARWVKDRHRDYGITYMIFRQQIWSVDRDDEGWRWMADRGDSSANHYDHIHISVE
jgi:hypothetical protein